MPAPATPAQEQKKTVAARSFEQNRAASREDRKRRDRIKYLEHEIAKLEKQMKALEEKLSAPTESDDIMELTRSYLEFKRSSDALTEEWGSLID